jgi:hypothetical protein
LCGGRRIAELKSTERAGSGLDARVPFVFPAAQYVGVMSTVIVPLAEQLLLPPS